MPTIAVTDYTFPNLDVEAAILEPLGGRLVAHRERGSAEALLPLVADADQVITQFAPVNATVIGGMRRAKVIVRYGIGVDNVDLEAARARGIPVCNVPDYCIDEVADHTLAFILGVTRQVVASTVSVRAGEWKLPVPLEGMRTLRDQTVGLVGLGRIGREVAARLRPFKCRILGHDPALTGAELDRLGVEGVPLEQLLGESDIVSLHCPSTPATRGLMDAGRLARMKRGVVLVNVARGDLVDVAALTAALESGQVAAAALDVFAPEPIPAGHPIRSMGQAILAAHIASASPRAVRRLRETVAQIVAASIRGEPLPNVVNGVRAVAR